jgi:hypothetical protein
MTWHLYFPTFGFNLFAISQSFICISLDLIWFNDSFNYVYETRQLLYNCWSSACRCKFDCSCPLLIECWARISGNSLI